jgi:hypothetical protein
VKCADSLCPLLPNEAPSLLEVPADRGLELEAAVNELLLSAAAGKIERGKGDEDFVPSLGEAPTWTCCGRCN